MIINHLLGYTMNDALFDLLRKDHGLAYANKAFSLSSVPQQQQPGMEPARAYVKAKPAKKKGYVNCGIPAIDRLGNNPKQAGDEEWTAYAYFILDWAQWEIADVEEVSQASISSRLKTWKRNNGLENLSKTFLTLR